VAIGLPVQVLIGGTLHFGAFVAILFAAFAAGRWSRTLRGCFVGVAVLISGAAAASLGGVVEAAEGLLDSPDELVFPLFYVSAAVATGRVVGTVARQAEELARLNSALEEEYGAAARLAVATERMRLSRDLHDSLAHTLMVTVVQAEVAENALSGDPERSAAAIRRVQEAGRTGLAELRATVRMLRTPEEAEASAPRLEELPALVSGLGAAGLEVDLEVSAAAADLSPRMSTELFRVAQEALTNITKHSAATTARVRVVLAPDEVLLEVTDPGPAAATDRPSGGHGLAGMGERAQALGGKLTAGPAAGGGWAVAVAVPLPEDRFIGEEVS